MPTVNGVYLKYVVLSACSFWGLTFLLRNSEGSVMGLRDLMSISAGRQSPPPMSLPKMLSLMALAYSALLNGMIAILFRMEWGMTLIGKDIHTGQIPFWSYVLYFPFHIPTMLYTHIHTLTSTFVEKTREGKEVRKPVPVASEVLPGWWIGGCYAHELNKDWAGVVDLTVEFPESTIARTKMYLAVPTWDGVPPNPAQLEEAARFAVRAKKLGGDVLVHCAHGRGRSTTVMCACLVKAGLFKNWEEALEKGIKPGRPVCKLNTRMKAVLTQWQALYALDDTDTNGVKKKRYSVSRIQFNATEPSSKVL